MIVFNCISNFKPSKNVRCVKKKFWNNFLSEKSKNFKKMKYVYLRITVDGIPAEFSIKKLWDSDRWNQSSGRATGTKDDARTLNAYLDLLSNKVFQAKTVLVETGRPITVCAIKNHVLGLGESKKTILEIFHDHNCQMKSLAGVNLLRERCNVTKLRMFIPRPLYYGNIKLKIWS